MDRDFNSVINKSRKSSNLVEVVLIVPLLMLIIFAILEYAIFQRNVNAVQDIALEMAVSASQVYVDEDNPISDPFVDAENPAVGQALLVFRRRAAALGKMDPDYTHKNMGSVYGTRPFAMYEFNSNSTTEYRGRSVPQYTITVDYRDPVSEGVSTQLIYYYNLILFGFEFAIPGVNGGRRIVIIPQSVQISSTQTKQYVHY